MDPDPEVGWTFTPNKTFEGTNEDGEPYILTTSAAGFFSPDLPLPSTFQLITLGDSFLSTFYVQRPIAWVLREKLGIPVFNLAVGGWGPENYRAAYEKYGVGRHAPVVVVFSFKNDITDVDNWMRWMQWRRTSRV